MNILKNHWYYFVIIGLLLYIFSLKLFSINSLSTIKQKIIIPEVIDSIEKPIGIIHHKGKKDSIIYKPGIIIRTENPINKKMAEELIQAVKDQDSLKILRLYLKSIEEKEETHVFKDKNQTIEVLTKVRGELLDQKIKKYIINEKETTVDVKVKESNFAVYTGANLNYTTELKLVPSATVGVQIGKRLIITGSYGLDKSVQGGILYKIKL